MRPLAQSEKDRQIEKIIGEALREAREAARLTQKQLGQAAGVTAKQVQKYENGFSGLPVSKLARMSRKHGIDARHILLLAERHQ